MLQLRLKLGLMKSSVKAMIKEGNLFLYLKNEFREVSEMKTEECIFKVTQDSKFEATLNPTDKAALRSLKRSLSIS
jgi:hypothetical protein